MTTSPNTETTSITTNLLHCFALNLEQAVPTHKNTRRAANAVELMAKLWLAQRARTIEIDEALSLLRDIECGESERVEAAPKVVLYIQQRA